MRQSGPVPARSQRGFTIMELMVVVAIVGVMTTLAMIGVQKSRYSGGVMSFANRIAAAADGARMRAIATQRWQRLELTPDQVTWWQASTQGLAAPVAWDHIRTLGAPRDVLVASMDTTVHMVEGVSVPAMGAGLTGTIDFSPDGTAQARTVFVSDEDEQVRARVAIYGATGTAYVFEGW